MRVYLQRGDRLESTSFHAECGEYEGGEIPLASPLRILADGRWLGRDLVQKRYGVSVHWVRLRTGAMACEEGGLWSFSEGRWQRGGEGDCLARLVAVKGDHLEWEGWDGDLYVRFRMSFGGEIGWNRQELWSQVRIRSLQQMRGFCERQALAVRVGDWVIKREGIWKILRKPVEREAFLRGEMWGELFIFEGIEKQGKQFIGKGTLFSASRTEEMSIVCRREPKPARMVPFAKGD